MNLHLVTPSTKMRRKSPSNIFQCNQINKINVFFGENFKFYISLYFDAVKSTLSTPEVFSMNNYCKGTPIYIYQACSIAKDGKTGLHTATFF